MQKRIFIFLLLLPLLCTAQRPTGNAGYHINWPVKYHPDRSSFFVHNEVEINAQPAVVWQLLIDAKNWSQWYNGASNVKYANTSQSVLDNETVFTWNTMNLHFTSTIKEFKPISVLCWESRKRSIKGYHAWLIIPTEKGCRVITDESQIGWLTFFEKIFQPQKLKGLHEVWLKELKNKAEKLHTNI